MRVRYADISSDPGSVRPDQRGSPNGIRLLPRSARYMAGDQGGRRCERFRSGSSRTGGVFDFHGRIVPGNMQAGVPDFAGVIRTGDHTELDS